MKPPYRAIVLLPAAALLLAACQHSSQETAAAVAAASSAKSALAATATAPATAGELSVTPSSMAACDPAAVADVHWNASRHAGVNTVQIHIGTGSSEKLFTEGGATGGAKIGQWVCPSAVFTAKAMDSGEMLLGRVTVAGPTCPSAG